jgi:nitrite reductase/ring-hydroxylating ferredoxin subunit
MTPNDKAGAPEDCGGCSLHDAFNAPAAVERRAFFRAAGLAIASLGILGLDAKVAQALPVRALSALGAGTGVRNDKRYPAPTSDGVAIDKDNSVIIARAGGKIYAFSLGCPHQNTALRWDEQDHQFMCPKHKSHYRDDGTFINGRATRDMDRLPIRRDGAELVVDVDTVYQQDDNPKEWAAAFVPA